MSISFKDGIDLIQSAVDGLNSFSYKGEKYELSYNEAVLGRGLRDNEYMYTVDISCTNEKGEKMYIFRKRWVKHENNDEFPKQLIGSILCELMMSGISKCKDTSENLAIHAYNRINR